jgi:hypothetical protein
MVQKVPDTVGEVGSQCDSSGVGLSSRSKDTAMSLRPQQSIPPVPDDTARVARAAFRRGNPYVLLRDQIGVMFARKSFGFR